MLIILKSYFPSFLFILIPFISIGMFVLVFVLLFSSRARAKMLHKQVKTMQYFTQESSQDLTDVLSDLTEVGLQAKSRVLNDNQDLIRDLNNLEADLKKDSIKTTFSAIKEGLSDNKETKYCKYCGSLIDGDSLFCKNCGSLIDGDSLFCKNCGKKQ